MAKRGVLILLFLILLFGLGANPLPVYNPDFREKSGIADLQSYPECLNGLTSPQQLGVYAYTATSTMLHWVDLNRLEDGYAVQRKTESGEFVTIATLAKDAIEYLDEGLDYDTSYIYRVYAFTITGNKQYSPEVQLKISATDWAPRQVKAVAEQKNVIDLSWVSAHSFADSIIVERRTPDTEYTEIARLWSVHTRYEDRFPVYNQRYYYRLKGVSQGYKSKPSQEVDSIMLLSAPQKLVVSPVRAKTVGVYCGVDSYLHDGITYERKIGNGDFEEIGREYSADDLHLVSGLQPGLQYTFRARLFVGKNYSAYSPEVRYTHKIEDFTPGKLKIIPTSARSVRLLWENNNKYGVKTKVERKTGNGTWQEIYQTEWLDGEFVDEKIDPNLAYTYRVRAESDGVFSNYSPELLYAFKMEAPGSLKLVSIAPGAVHLSWRDVNDHKTGFVLERKTGKGSYETIAQLSAKEWFYTDKNLNSQQKYTYRIKPIADNYSGNYSPESIWNGFEADFVKIPAGKFYNGTAEVNVSAFYLHKFETSHVSYKTIMGKAPYEREDPTTPIAAVSWFDAIEYCNRLSLIAGYTPCYSFAEHGTNPDDWPETWNQNYQNHTQIDCNWKANGFRLPTEAEWQFAAQDAMYNANPEFTGAENQKPGAKPVSKYAHYGTNTFNTPKSVGSKAASKLGLYDMFGNVWEWVWDIFQDYPKMPLTNPKGAQKGDNRVIRGGSYSASAEKCTVDFRDYMAPLRSKNNVGFRICRIVQ